MPIRPSLLLTLVVLAAPAQAADNRCLNELGNQPRARSSIASALARTVKIENREERLEKLSALAGQVRNASETGMVDLARGAVLLELGRPDEAVAVWDPLIENRMLYWREAALLRVQLATLAGSRNDWPRLVALLEPPFKDNCSLPASGEYLLARGYLALGQAADALAALDSAHAPPAADREWWTAVQAELTCKVRGAEACAAKAVMLARLGGLTAAVADVLNKLISGVAADSSAAPVLERGRTYGWIDADNRVVMRDAMPTLTPISRARPWYPEEAARKGVEGWVQVLVKVAPDGQVSDVDVLDAQPAGVFERTAVAAARQARFKAPVIDGKAVESTGVYTVTFSLGGSAGIKLTPKAE